MMNGRALVPRGRPANSSNSGATSDRRRDSAIANSGSGSGSSRSSSPGGSSSRSSSGGGHGSKAGEVLRTQVHSFKRAWKRLSDSVWEQVMAAACCAAGPSPSPSTCGPGIGPFGYHRLQSSLSSSSGSARVRSAVPAPWRRWASFNDNNGVEELEAPPPPPHPHPCAQQDEDHGQCTAAAAPDPAQDRNHAQHSHLGAALTPPPVLHSFRVSDAAHDHDNTVVLKVCLLGDPETGKSSFMARYVNAAEHHLSEDYVETMGVEATEKVFRVQNANIAFSIWDMGGHWQYESMLPMVCRDAVAIIIMFDLTKRSTLSSVKGWFLQARELNKTALTVIVGTKYDHFVQLPQNIQFAIMQQARLYAHAMGASGLFFSSTTHGINVHKIFKVIVAKLFDLPCNIPRNLNLGEPLIDY